jgi:hypothetical protein
MQEDPKLSDELRKMEHEPILPIERKLVLWSVITGVLLLTLLAAVSRFW